MALLRSWHKTSLWSQFVLGLIAMFALPEIQALPADASEINTTLTQRTESLAHVHLEQQLPRKHLIQRQQQLPIVQQAVNLSDFFAKAYSFDGDFNHPIRAGPFLV